MGEVGEMDIGASDPATPVAHGTAESIPEGYLTFNNDRAIGVRGPEIRSLEYIHMNGPTDLVVRGQATVVLFWAKYAKGDYRTVQHFGEMAQRWPQLTVIGISCDG